jgi:hypothetical protein
MEHFEEEPPTEHQARATCDVSGDVVFEDLRGIDPL